MSKIRLLLLVGGVAASFAATPYANAADAVIETDPAPPEPVAEAPVSDGGFYVAARIGGAFADDTEFGAAGTTINNEYDTGYLVSGAIGYDFATGSAISYRVEGEIGYQQFEIDQHDVAGVGTFSGGDANGDTSSIYGLANAYIDYDLGVVSPYIGFGVGYASVDLSDHGVTPTGTVMDDSGEGLAWQVGGGASYALTDSVKLEAGYRYTGVEDVSVTAIDGTSSDLDLRAHQVTLGIRKTF